MDSHYSGGNFQAAFEPTDQDGHGHQVAVTNFPFAGLDTPESRIREALTRNGSANAAIDEIVEERLAKAVYEQLTKILDYIVYSKKPRKAALEVAWATNMGVAQGLSIEDLAQKCNCSKQALQQGAQRACRKIGIQMRRSEEACENMSKACANKKAKV